MRKLFTIIAGIFLTLLFTACEQFTADMDAYLSYWSTEVASTGFEIEAPYINMEGVPYISSANNAKVTIKLRNPKNFTLKTPATPADAGKVIRFPGLLTQPEHGTAKDYTLIQTAKDRLTLTYHKDFLKKHEWGTGDIGANITFIADDGRVFDKRFSVKLKVNTPPALEYKGKGKTQVGSEWYYVLLFRVKDMDTMIGGQRLHKDIKTLNVTVNGGTPVDIPLTFNSSNTDFATGENLLAASAVQKINPADEDLSSDAWVLRLKTNVKVDGPATSYAVSVKDELGFSSEVIKISTDTLKLPDVKLLDGVTPITGTTESAPFSFPGMDGKALTATAHSGAGITGTIYKHDGSIWNEIRSVSGTTPVTVNLPALDSSENEAFYKITLKASLTGYAESNEKEFFVKLLRQELPVLKLMQDFSASSQSDQKNISAATKGYVTEDIIPDAENYKTVTTPLVIYNLNGAAKLVIAPRIGSGATVKYTLNSGSEQSATTETHIPLNGSPSYTLKAWAEKDHVEGPKTTLHIKVIKAVTTYGELKNVVQNAPAGDEIGINIGSDLTALDNPEITVSDGKKLTLRPNSGHSSHTIDAAENGRIFNIRGAGTELILEDIKLRGGVAADGKGGAAYVEAGGILALTGTSVITPSTGADANTPGKNDVYLDIEHDATIKAVGTLTGTAPLARITPAQYSAGHAALTGDIAMGTPNNYTKFTVTQEPDSEYVWKIKNDGKLESIPRVIKNSDSHAWQKLKNTVQNVPEGTTIIIDGEIKATDASGNSDEIVIDKNLTIQGATGAATDILNANSNHKGTPPGDAPTTPHRIFKVESGKTLTLENLTLTGGKADGAGEAGNGGAIFARGAAVNIEKCTLMSNTATTNGGGIYAEGAVVNITNCTLKGNSTPMSSEAFGGAIYAKKIGTTPSTVTISGGFIGKKEDGDDGNKAKNGGGIWVGEGCILTLNEYTDGSGAKHGVQLIGNQSNSYGGGVCAEGAAVNITNCTFKGNTSSVGGAICAYKHDGSPQSVTISGGAIGGTDNDKNEARRGGGIYVGKGYELTLEGSVQITGNNAKAGSGVYVRNSSTIFRMKESAKVNTNNDVYLAAEAGGNVAKITIDGILSPEGGTAAHITVPDDKYNSNTQVLEAGSGVTLANETYKFAVTPKEDSGNTYYWEVDNQGKLMRIVDGVKYPYKAWKALKDVVSVAGTDPITINGSIQATDDADNKGTININDNITIKGKNGRDTDILDAGKKGGRIFSIPDGSNNKLNLEKLTLKGGSVNGNDGAAIIVGRDAEAELSACTIEECEALNGGAIAIWSNGKATLTNTDIKNCSAKLFYGNPPPNGSGGAIYAAGGTVIMTNCTLTGNTAENNGGAVYAKKISSPTPILSTVTIEGGTIGGTGTNANKATGTGTGEGLGGGIYIGESCTLNLQDYTDSSSNKHGAKVIGNTAKAKGGGVYVDGTFIMSGHATVLPSTGENTDKPRQNDVYLDDGSKIELVGILTPKGGTAARITVPDANYAVTTQVLDGSITDNYTKFTVTPNGGVTWTIDDQGKLKQ